MAFQNHSECLSTFQKFKGGVMDIQKEFTDFAVNSGWCVDGESTQNGFLFYNAQTNDRWIGWQAATAQAVPEGFVLVDKHQLAQLMANMDSFGKKALGDDYVSFADIAAVLDEAQEPAND